MIYAYLKSIYKYIWCNVYLIFVFYHRTQFYEIPNIYLDLKKISEKSQYYSICEYVYSMYMYVQYNKISFRI